MELPTLSRPGFSAIFRLPVLAARGGTKNTSGLLLSLDGRLTLAVENEGLVVRLGLEDCATVGVLLLQLAEKLAAEERAADDADNLALERTAPVGSA
jgi:hypothetical protein